MKRTRALVPRNPRGSVLVFSLIFIAMFSALAAAMATLSGANVQVAENFRRADTTRACAESGVEVIRYWASKVDMSGTIAPSERFTHLAATLQSELAAAGITNIVPTVSGSTITIPEVPLLSSGSQSFSALLTSLDVNNVQLDVTGYYAGLSRTIRSNFVFGERANTVFDFGVASKGPISLSGNIELSGVNISVESNAYIESLNHLLALSIIGNSQIAGNVKIVNPSAYVYLQGGKAGIGGDVGVAAMSHVTIPAPPSEFPEMVPGPLQAYATNAFDSGLNLKKAVTLTNVYIPPNTNPKFSGNATIRGVLYVQTPNVVEFTGGATITGIIVTNGDQTDDSGTSRLIFRGNVNSHSVAGLPQETQFAGLHSQTGTFIIAPGFAVSFGGTFSTLNGVTFFGNAGGTIRGSVINYANREMTLGGNSDLLFNRSGLDKLPAGFVPEIVLHYDRSSYTEVVL